MSEDRIERTSSLCVCVSEDFQASEQNLIRSITLSLVDNKCNLIQLGGKEREKKKTSPRLFQDYSKYMSVCIYVYTVYIFM